MAEVDKRHYKMCSGTDTVQLPVQIHMSNNSEFMSKISQNEQDSHSDKLNYNAVVESSDSERTPKYTKYFQ